MFARNAKMPKILLPSSSGISGNAINIGCYIFNKCKHQNKNGLRKIPYKKSPNFIRTKAWHFDNLMSWLVRLGSIK